MITIPSLVKTFDTTDLMAYGAATWDWHRIHYDRDAARAAGLPDVLVDGQLFGALFARQVRAAFGPHAFLQSMRLRYLVMAFAGDTVTAHAESLHDAAREETSGTRRLHLRQTATRGDTPIATAESLVVLPSNAPLSQPGRDAS